MTGLSVRHMSLEYRVAGRPPIIALRDVSLEAEAQEFIVVLGASGCGKTSLLNLIAGFLHPTSGEIRVGGKPVTSPGADRGVVFQRNALMPWLNVLHNVELGLKLTGVPRDARREIARRNLALVGLADFACSPIYELSGGMQQRVGLARALTCDPVMMLMDEPLGALDEFTREEMQVLILDLWARSHKLIFMITHSVEEAVFMATQLIVMSPRPGRIVQQFRLDFGRTYLETRDARAVKSSTEFIEMRENVLDIVRATTR
ncbi:taurine ABC transporter ATP-binding protein [Shinella granuli]|nr:ATP-binding cassette domain-containing protein [Shinella granuli]